jgi:hypothetical protein
MLGLPSLGTRACPAWAPEPESALLLVFDPLHHME